MAWVRIDDHFDEHPKLARVGPLGWGVWLAGLAYCNRNLTDGFIPWSKARTLCSFEVIEDDGQVWDLSRTSGMAGNDIEADWVIGLLLDAGLWEEAANGRGRIDGYRIHDYEEYQPSKEQVTAERQAAKERMQRRRSGESRTSSNGSSVDVRPNIDDVRTKFKDPVPNPVPNPVPVPVPVPTPEPTGETTTGPRATSAPSPPEPDSPYVLYKALCEELGAAPESPPPGKQLKIAKRLIAAGIPLADVRACLRYLRSEDWRTGLIDLGTVESQIEAWRLNGRPATAQARASPNGNGKGGLTSEQIRARAGRPELTVIETEGSIRP